MSDCQETALTLYRGEAEWKLSTSDTTIKNLLARRGYEPDGRDEIYENYSLPLRAITIRSKSSLEPRAAHSGHFGANGSRGGRKSILGSQNAISAADSDKNGGCET